MTGEVVSADDTRRHDHHNHRHEPELFGRAFLIGATLNIGFVGLEALYGWLANSVALLADAGHNLSDVLGLLVAWGASALARRKPSARYTYGLRRATILAALFNAIILLMAVGAIGLEAAKRIAEPQPVAGGTVMAVAAVGVVVNTLTALLFARGRKGDLNVRAAFLHMASDAAVSLGVVVAGLAIQQTGWLWLDPLASLTISAVIVAGTWRLLRDSLAMSLDAVPSGIDSARVTESLVQLPGVAGVHDLHIWPMSTTEVALTCHLIVANGYPGEAFLSEVAKMLHERFDIEHATIQIELAQGLACRQICEEARDARCS